MNKNNNKTMNERKHNAMESYKKSLNTNSNNTNIDTEFSKEFDAIQKRATPDQLSNEK